MEGERIFLQGNRFKFIENFGQIWFLSVNIIKNFCLKKKALPIFQPYNIAKTNP